jgi:hypothetical protein
MMKPLRVEVVSNLITAFGSCGHCELMMSEAGVKVRARHQDMADYPAALREELAKLSDWLSELCRLYRHRISIRLIDAQSPLGLYKSLVHRIRRYPTFVIEKKEVYSGWDRKKFEELLDACMRAANLRGACG